ncbi:glycosyltransferase family 2 protein [Halococcus sp. IIIV-5B]|uniref:glycosyltransferase n=1 Tax=Halococcus sp. IIIV-5B TaxID=2321230 RepID=UPI0013143E24|nr:glycosyltransferase [Halococcus sp. IIIV-5B]
MWLVGFFYVLTIVAAPVFVFALLGGVIAPLSVVFLIALTLVFFYYSYFLPIALIDVGTDPDSSASAPYPTVSVLVPAYNEEGSVGATIDALQESEYPSEAREIVVIDDGSTDRTYHEANWHANEGTKVVQKENGGKHSAMNYGLLYAEGDIIVTVDADSIVAPDALSKLVGAFQADADLGAVAGNIKVDNRESLVRKLQTLEYIVGILVFRRAFSAFGSVPVVPGALGAYRREALSGVHFYDPDTLTEDFDASIKTLKQGWRIEAVDALCYTEAPMTWQDLYNQRLRWYRGNFMTLLKHRDILFNTRFGHLQGVVVPMMLLNLTVIPIAGFVIFGSIISQLLIGNTVEMLLMFAFFSLLQGLLSIIALWMDDDRMRLAMYAPLFIVGYRQFLDTVVLKSVFDVLMNRDLHWTSAKRSAQRLRMRDHD